MKISIESGAEYKSFVHKTDKKYKTGFIFLSNSPGDNICIEQNNLGIDNRVFLKITNIRKLIDGLDLVWARAVDLKEKE